MKLIHGHYLPDGDREKWLAKSGFDRNGWSLYQRDRLNAIAAHCSGRRRFIDGGAHIGLYARPASILFDRVEAFEPFPATLECLRANLQPRDRFANVTVNEFALYQATAGRVTMAHAKKDASMSTRVDVLGNVAVNTVTIDYFQWDDVDAIKLDLEGCEYEALRGATETLKRCRPVVLIEEKHNFTKSPSEYLRHLGMREVWREKRDHLFVWP